MTLAAGAGHRVLTARVSVPAFRSVQELARAEGLTVQQLVKKAVLTYVASATVKKADR